MRVVLRAAKDKKFRREKSSVKKTFGKGAVIWVGAGIAAIAMTLVSGASHAQTWFEDNPREDKEMSARFDALDAVSSNAQIPALPDLPKLATLDTPAPSGSTLYRQAYSMADGCKFFSSGQNADLAIGARWSGAPCKNGLISGKGSLSVVIQVREGDGKTSYAYKTYQGEFSDGFLHGNGVKNNVLYTGARQPTGVQYRQEGTFKYGVLDGQGHKFTIYKKGSTPAATMEEGQFVAGTPVGHVFLVRNNPFAGAIADQYELIYNKDGLSLRFPTFSNDKKPLSGRIRFAGKGGEWRMQLTAFNNDLPEGGKLMKTVKSEKQAGSAEVYAGDCRNWIIAGNGDWQCEKGSYLDGHSLGVTFGLFDGPFAFNPQSPRAWRHDVDQRIAIRVTGASEAADDEWMRCNADHTECKGKTRIPLTFCAEYRGPAELKQGKLVPAGGPGEFYRKCKSAPVSNPDAKKRILEPLQHVNELRARCDRFDSPLRCAQGTQFLDKGTVHTGAFVLDNIRVGTLTDEPDAVAVYQVINENEPLRYKSQDWVKITFSDGSWAKVRMVDGDMVEAGACDAPGVAIAYCKLKGANTVVFVQR